MSSPLEALMARQEDRANWERAIDHLQWCLLNNQRVPAHERAVLIEKANILRRQPSLVHMEKMAGFSFHDPFGKWIDEAHWKAIRELAERLADAK